MKPCIVIGIGNPSRGDDALGPLCIERLESLRLPSVELLTDFQLQVEYLLDLHGRQEVIFVDAAVSGPEPYACIPISAEQDTSYSSHALSPQALLAAYVKHYGKEPPPAYLLGIRGYEFELGERLSAQANDNLEAAVGFLVGTLRTETALPRSSTIQTG